MRDPCVSMFLNQLLHWVRGGDGHDVSVVFNWLALRSLCESISICFSKQWMTKDMLFHYVHAQPLCQTHCILANTKMVQWTVFNKRYIYIYISNSFLSIRRFHYSVEVIIIHYSALGGGGGAQEQLEHTVVIQSLHWYIKSLFNRLYRSCMYSKWVFSSCLSQPKSLEHFLSQEDGRLLAHLKTSGSLAVLPYSLWFRRCFADCLPESSLQRLALIYSHLCLMVFLFLFILFIFLTMWRLALFQNKVNNLVFEFWQCLH